MARDEFSAHTRRIIAGRVGWQCSHPECNASTVGPTDDSTRIYNLGAACHIAAAAPGGPRFDESMTEAERSHVDNGIWMCRIHAKQIDDDVSEFPAELLRQWKKEAEERACRRLGKPTKFDTSAPEIVQFSQARIYGLSSIATTESGHQYYSASVFDIEKEDPRYYLAGTFILRFALLKPLSQRSITLFELRAVVSDFEELPALAPPNLSAYPQTVYPYIIKLMPPDGLETRVCAARLFWPSGHDKPVEFSPLLIDDDVPQIIDVRFNASRPGIYQFALDAVLMQGVELQTLRVQPPIWVLFEPGDEDHDPNLQTRRRGQGAGKGHS